MLPSGVHRITASRAMADGGVTRRNGDWWRTPTQDRRLGAGCHTAGLRRSPPDESGLPLLGERRQGLGRVGGGEVDGL